MYITNKFRSDGFGAQYQCIIFTILFAELMNIEFVYSPFVSMDHNYDDDPNYLDKKEKLINLIGNYSDKNNVDQSKIMSFDLSHIYKTVEDNLDYCLSTSSFKKIKDLFYENKNNKNEGKNINIHIRRPNRFDIGDYGYTDDDYYLKIIEEIYKKNNDIKKIKIHSQGDVSNFSKFSKYDIDFKLNSPIEESFADLVFSDILVLSKSSFSYSAGLLCNGEVYYLPFWHKPKKTWIKI
jgi:hypothetical protein